MGYVYLASTESYAKNNKYKIGRTINLEKRMKELGAGHVEDFEIVKSWKCNDENADESIVHKALSGQRVSANREFFYGPKEELIKKIDSILPPIPFNSNSGVTRPDDNHSYHISPEKMVLLLFFLSLLFLSGVLALGHLASSALAVDRAPGISVVQSKENAE